ncbi:TetR/AcrR family transcriptional regulator [Lacticaseibacillus kribbianus]|uniref:TetR/AcrR family transcriptional regulator n=1 Tax=Lacticaseibacillus kribbianus TaxID=2926292 RepID=UPI001CD807C4|nr:TetR/AcrR family transcriptional regulator [Lacticaseibacillus kribbianus]
MPNTTHGGLDLRIRKTRRAIIHALFDLLRREDFASITVLQLVAAAEIGQTTFYRHYQDKYALAQAAIDDCLARLNPVLIHRLASEGLPRAIQPQPGAERGLIAEIALLRKIDLPEVSFQESARRQFATQIQAELRARKVALRYPAPIAKHFAALIYSFLMVVTDQGPDYDAAVIEDQITEFRKVLNIVNNIS